MASGDVQMLAAFNSHCAEAAQQQASAEQDLGQFNAKQDEGRGSGNALEYPQSGGKLDLATQVKQGCKDEDMVGLVFNTIGVR
ncbi:hypothetical protein C0993_009798 [Termitomyces sp. T159_Od127]|nr:hypothetical protein C0993_009798 [Termitomyces sp. T159_Od127]